MAERLHIQHYHSTTGGTPTAENLEMGEIAVGSKAGEEKFFIKNTNEEIVTFEPLVSMTTDDIDLIWDSYFSTGYGSGSASSIAEDDVINSVGVGDYEE